MTSSHSSRLHFAAIDPPQFRCPNLSRLHRAGQSLGERKLRELQREAAGRVLEWGDLLLAEGGADRDRTLAGRIQREAAALGARLQAAGAGGL